MWSKETKYRKDIQKLIKKYLDKNYLVYDNVFKNYNSLIEYGDDIVKELSIIFNYEEEECKGILHSWSYRRGLRFEKWAKNPLIKLNYTWTTEMIRDMYSFSNLPSESETILTDLLSAEISREIDREILNSLLNANNPTYSVRREN